MKEYRTNKTVVIIKEQPAECKKNKWERYVVPLYPVFTALITAGATLLILWLVNVFDSKSILLDAKAIRLENQIHDNEIKVRGQRVQVDSFNTVIRKLQHEKDSVREDGKRLLSDYKKLFVVHDLTKKQFDAQKADIARSLDRAQAAITVADCLKAKTEIENAIRELNKYIGRSFDNSFDDSFN